MSIKYQALSCPLITPLSSGVSSLSFKLPSLVKDGTWTIRVKVQDQVTEQLFQVHTYFMPLFEVRIVHDKIEPPLFCILLVVTLVVL